MFKLPDGIDLNQFSDHVSKLSWFHSFHIGGGLFTPGRDLTEQKLAALDLPADLTGKTVLDIGCADGFFAFECASRGAVVTAIDDYMWTPPHNSGKVCFDFLQEIFPEAKVTGKFHSMNDISSYALGQFDIVLFLGVLYHLENPLGVLKGVRQVTKERLIVETLVDCLDVPRAALAYYHGDIVMHDDSNTFAPNLIALEGMLKDSGFANVEPHSLWSVDTVKASGYDIGQPAGSSGRVVVHAW